ncbi:zinc-binding metallopeptidase family protein [Niabella ginsengisoli]|uniref:Uncharacterized protein n=1 Tax=Niabella ginsengisoli TaxID=522298 RepID=A0ABS9SIC1_9BACT|nr:hypothetical protein [Niabella ginsengisoli]MCH5598113.1 hypothetical protein [Niabella ginsengisoli]
MNNKKNENKKTTNICSPTYVYHSYILCTKNIAVNITDVTKTINVLASDEMKGRNTGSPEIDKAADFIASEFKKAGLKPLAKESFLQSFSMVSATQKSISAKSGGKELDPKNIIVLTASPDLNFTSANSTIEKIIVGDNLFQKQCNMLPAIKT